MLICINLHWLLWLPECAASHADLCFRQTVHWLSRPGVWERIEVGQVRDILFVEIGFPCLLVNEWSSGRRSSMAKHIGICGLCVRCIWWSTNHCRGKGTCFNKQYDLGEPLMFAEGSHMSVGILHATCQCHFFDCWKTEISNMSIFHPKFGMINFKWL